MAKKKNTKSKTATPRTTKKNSFRATSARSDATAVKSSRKSSNKASKDPGGSAAASRRRSTSVDGILNKFNKERLNLDSSLTAIRKKILELKAKTRAFEEQIAKLTKKELETEEAIQQVDARRDTEVGELLSKLGVNLGSPTEQAAACTPPIAGVPQNTSESKTTDEEETYQFEEDTSIGE